MDHIPKARKPNCNEFTAQATCFRGIAGRLNAATVDMIKFCIVKFIPRNQIFDCIANVWCLISYVLGSRREHTH